MHSENVFRWRPLWGHSSRPSVLPSVFKSADHFKHSKVVARWIRRRRQAKARHIIKYDSAWLVTHLADMFDIVWSFQPLPVSPCLYLSLVDLVGHWGEEHSWNLEPCHGSDRHVHLHRLDQGQPWMYESSSASSHMTILLLTLDLDLVCTSYMPCSPWYSWVVKYNWFIAIFAYEFVYGYFVCMYCVLISTSSRCKSRFFCWRAREHWCLQQGAPSPSRSCLCSSMWGKCGYVWKWRMGVPQIAILIGKMLMSQWTELYFQKLIEPSPPIGMNQALNNHGPRTFMKADMSQ